MHSELRLKFTWTKIVPVQDGDYWLTFLILRHPGRLALKACKEIP